MAGVQGDKNMADYIKGVDLSAVVEVEELGAKYYDNGVQGDIFDILKNYGVNSVRLRLWRTAYLMARAQMTLRYTKNSRSALWIME